MPRDLDLSSILADLHTAPDADETVDRAVEFATTAVGCDGAGILLLHARNRVETVAATGAAVERAHDLQVELDEGPCVGALEDGGSTVIVPDTRLDRRWPRWSDAVSALGLRSVLSLPLNTSNRCYGSLNLYWHLPDAVDEETVAIASVLARHAAIALGSSVEIDNLRRAVDARKLIGIAMGVLMERYRIDTEQAFAVLRRYSQQKNVKLRDVAEAVVSGQV